MKYRMNLTGVQILSQTKNLPDGVSIKVTSIFGHDTVEIRYPGQKEYISYGNIFVIPKSDTAPDGWGAPITLENAPLGTVGGDPNGVIISRNGTKVSRAVETSLPFNVDWVDTSKKIHLHWSVGSPQYLGNEYPYAYIVNRYFCFPNGLAIFKDNDVLCSGPSGEWVLAGTCVTEFDDGQYLIAIMSNNVLNSYIQFTAFKRPLLDSYINNNLYNATTNPNGWQNIGQETFNFPETIVTTDLSPTVEGLTIRSGIYFSSDGKIGGAAAFSQRSNPTSSYNEAYSVGEFIFEVSYSSVSMSFIQVGGKVVTSTTNNAGGGGLSGTFNSTSYSEYILGVDYTGLKKVYIKLESSTVVDLSQTEGTIIGDTGPIITTTGGRSSASTSVLTVGGTQFEFYFNEDTSWFSAESTEIPDQWDSSISQSGFIGLNYADARYSVAVVQGETSSSMIERYTRILPENLTIHSGNRDGGTPYTPDPSGAFVWDFRSVDPNGTTVINSIGQELFKTMRCVPYSENPDVEHSGTYAETPSVISGVTDIDGNSFIIFPKQIDPVVTPVGAANNAPYVDPLEQVAWYKPWGLNVVSKLQMIGDHPRWSDLKLI